MEVLEGRSDEERGSITADRLKKILEAINRVESIRKPSTVEVSSCDPEAPRTSMQKWNEDHQAIMQVVNATERKCSETYSRIKNRLRDLAEISASNLALRRLIKRNMKREGRIANSITNMAESGGFISESDRQALRSQHNQICKMPFLVANYVPEPSAVRPGAKGRALGLENRGQRLALASKVPIRAFDD